MVTPNGDKKFWQSIGARRAHADAKGFNLRIDYLPLEDAGSSHASRVTSRPRNRCCAYEPTTGVTRPEEGGVWCGRKWRVLLLENEPKAQRAATCAAGCKFFARDRRYFSRMALMASILGGACILSV